MSQAPQSSDHGSPDRYQAIEEIARGGVGVIWRARDTSLEREVAIKVLRDEHLKSDEVRQRFIEEAQIGGQLQHPGIVPVYELGTDAEGKPFFAMKLVRGETLAAQLARRADPSAERARFLQIFEQICQTAAFAHARRVVHRDLKPANVMIGTFGEVQVVDWGFAKVLSKEAAQRRKIEQAKTASIIKTVRTKGDSSTHSEAGSVFGTPAYMPPEQALGYVDLLDARSDVFALGAILCEILSGSPPYLASDGEILLQASRHDLRPAKERLARSSAEPVLAELCLRCMRPDPEHRPSSAQIVANEIGAYRAAVEARAHRAEIDAVASRVRFRATLAVGAVLVAGLVAAGAIWMGRERDAERQRDAARHRVATAFAAAERLAGEARAATQDAAAAWDRAQTAVEAAQRSAAADEVEPVLRASVEALAGSIDKERSGAHGEAHRGALERQLFAAIAELRVPLDHDVSQQEQRRGEAQRLGQAYARAFAAFLEGRSPQQLVPAEIEALRARPRATQLAWAFDDWALAVSEERPLEAEALRRLARELDPASGWRADLRALLHDPRASADALVRLVEGVNASELEPSGLQMLARALTIAGKHEGAVRLLRRACQAHPADPGLGFELGLALERQAPEPWHEIIGHYERARALAPENRGLIHRLGIALRYVGRITEARLLFELLCARDPEDMHWLGHAGQLQLEDGDVETGIATMKRAIEGDPSNMTAPYNLGSELYDLGRYAEAEAWFAESIRRDGGFPPAHANLGNSIAGQNEHQRAIPHYERALALDPDLFEAHVGLTNAWNTLSAFEQAEVHARRAAELRPRSTTALINFGIVQGRLGRRSEAEAALRRAAELDPSDPSATLQLTFSLDEHGRESEQVEILEKLLARFPDHPQAWSKLGIVYGNLDLHQRAIECFEHSLQLDPDHTTARINLGYRRAYCGEHAIALEHFEESRAWLEDHPSAFAEEWIPLLEQEIARVQRAIANAQLLDQIASEAGAEAEFEDEQEAAAVLRGRGLHRELARLWQRISEKRGVLDLRWRRVRIADTVPLATADPDAEQRRAGRAHVLKWMREELALEAAGGAGSPGEEKAARLRYWISRPYLRELRESEELARLPEGEAAEWGAFWREFWREVK